METVADALSLAPGDVVTDTHPPQAASVGLPFLFAELRSIDALGQVRVSAGGLEKLRAEGAPLAIHVYVHSGERALRARMLVTEGGYEDPATGSANCALAAMLSQLDPTRDGELRWEVTQGVEMGRPREPLQKSPEGW